jgi:hypothetical protein
MGSAYPLRVYLMDSVISYRTKTAIGTRWTDAEMAHPEPGSQRQWFPPPGREWRLEWPSGTDAGAPMSSRSHPRYNGQTPIPLHEAAIRDPRT